VYEPEIIQMGPQSRLLPTPLPTAHTSSLWIRFAFWASIVIAIAVVIRRIVALTFPSPNLPPQMRALDSAFASHAALTLAHIIPALAFVLISPFVVFSRFSRLVWPARAIFPLGLVVAITAYAMSAYPTGGWTERSAVLFFNSLFLFSLLRAFWYRRTEQALKRRWLLRAIAILLGIATTRPVMGIFFATSPRTHLAPSQFFGIAFWIGFSLNWVAFELWIRSRDRQLQPARASIISQS
jgi:hypothetical protein